MTELRQRYWEIRIKGKISIQDFSKIACVSIPTLRKFEREESTTRMTVEKIKLAIKEIENGNKTMGTI